MKIVIDIPEEIYLNAKTDMLCGTDVIVNAIKNGIPLPKGHGRLIDGDELERRMKIGYNIVKAAKTIIEADKAESEGEE